MDHQQVYYFITLFAVGCSSKPLAAIQQDPWTLESPMLQHGVPLNFANMTVVGVGETLTWTWASPKGDSWQVVVRFSAAGKLKGKWEYMRSRGDRRPLRLSWERVNKKTKWMQHPVPEAKPPPWKLNLRDIIELHFKPKNGSWEFQVGGDKIYSEKPEEKSGFKNGKGLRGARGINSAQASVEATDYGIADGRSSNAGGVLPALTKPGMREIPTRDNSERSKGKTEGLTKMLKYAWDSFFAEGKGHAKGCLNVGLLDKFNTALKHLNCLLRGKCSKEPVVPQETPTGRDAPLTKNFPRINQGEYLIDPSLTRNFPGIKRDDSVSGNRAKIKQRNPVIR